MPIKEFIEKLKQLEQLNPNAKVCIPHRSMYDLYDITEIYFLENEPTEGIIILE